MFESLLVSTGIVALAEIGDKTQLLALLLAALFRPNLHLCRLKLNWLAYPQT